MTGPKKAFIAGWIILWSLFALNLFSQGTGHSSYYNQKKSLFDLLPNSKGEIIFLGDSITDGCEWAELFGLPKIINRGISGDTTEGVLERLGEVTESRPAAIFLMIGVNDLGAGKSAAFVLKKTGEIIRKIRRITPLTRLYVQSLLPVNKKFSQFPNYTNKTSEILAVNKGLKTFCRRNGVNYIDLFPSFTTADLLLNPAYTNDGLHLKGDGYLLWKSLIERFVIKKD